MAAAFRLIDSIVEIYLASVIKPFLRFHETFYSSLNRVLRSLLDDNNIPEWFTANFITYARTAVVVPTILFLVWEHTVFPAILVILVDFGDFLDGVVARYWVDTNRVVSARSASPSNSDDDSFGTYPQVSSASRAPSDLMQRW